MPIHIDFCGSKIIYKNDSVIEVLVAELKLTFSGFMTDRLHLTFFVKSPATPRAVQTCSMNYELFSGQQLFNVFFKSSICHH